MEKQLDEGISQGISGANPNPTAARKETVVDLPFPYEDSHYSAPNHQLGIIIKQLNGLQGKLSPTRIELQLPAIRSRAHAGELVEALFKIYEKTPVSASWFIKLNASGLMPISLIGDLIAYRQSILERGASCTIVLYHWSSLKPEMIRNLSKFVDFALS